MHTGARKTGARKTGARGYTYAKVANDSSVNHQRMLTKALHFTFIAFNVLNSTYIAHTWSLDWRHSHPLDERIDRTAASFKSEQNSYCNTMNE